MKMRKMLAFVAVLAMAGATGVNAFAEEAVTETSAELAAEAQTETVTEAEAGTSAAETLMGTETDNNGENAAVEGIIEEDVITKAYDADFTIGEDSFFTKIDSYYIVIYKITDKDSAVQVGKIELDSLINYVDHYEVYGNQLVVVCYADDGAIATVDYYYDSATGEFHYVKDTDNVEYDKRKQQFELNGVSFIAELLNVETTENGLTLELSVYFEDGTATNLQNVQVNKDVMAGDLAGEAFTYNVNNYFTVSGDNLIVYHEDKMNANRTSTTYIFNKATSSFIESGTDSDSSGNTVTDSAAGSTANSTANSPSTGDTMSIPAAAGSAAVVLGAVIYVSRKRR